MIKILAIDPSGEGSTGIVEGTLDGKVLGLKTFKRKKYKDMASYCNEIEKLMLEADFVVCESYRLQGGSVGQAQTGSTLETPLMLGRLEAFANSNGIKIKFQPNVIISRWNRVNLQRKINYQDFLKKPNRHEMDALRHYVHYITFTHKKIYGGEK